MERRAQRRRRSEQYLDPEAERGRRLPMPSRSRRPVTSRTASARERSSLGLEPVERKRRAPSVATPPCDWGPVDGQSRAVWSGRGVSGGASAEARIRLSFVSGWRQGTQNRGRIPRDDSGGVLAAATPLRYQRKKRTR